VRVSNSRTEHDASPWGTGADVGPLRPRSQSRSNAEAKPWGTVADCPPRQPQLALPQSNAGAQVARGHVSGVL
jgi:hypothetical protein